MSEEERGTAWAAAAAAELAAQGFPRIPAQVIMALTAHPEGRMTSAELVADLGASPAAISGAVRYLATLGFVRQATVPGTRRHLYTLPPLPWYSSTLTQDRYSHMVEVLARGLDQLADPARERVDEMIAFFRYLQEEMPQMWARWRATRGDAAGGSREASGDGAGE